MAKLKTLTDVNGNKIYPQTSAAAVYMADGRTVEMAIGGGGSGEASYDNLPVGSIVSSVLPITDSRFLECRGQVVSKYDYPELVNILPWDGTGEETIKEVTIFEDATIASSAYMNKYVLNNKIFTWIGLQNLAGSYKNQLWSSTDNGETWQIENFGGTGTFRCYGNHGVISLVPSTINVVPNASTPVYYTQDGYNWEKGEFVGLEYNNSTSSNRNFIGGYGNYLYMQMYTQAKFFYSKYNMIDKTSYVPSFFLDVNNSANLVYDLDLTGAKIYPLLRTSDEIAFFGTVNQTNTYRDYGVIASDGIEVMTSPAANGVKCVTQTITLNSKIYNWSYTTNTSLGYQRDGYKIPGQNWIYSSQNIAYPSEEAFFKDNRERSISLSSVFTDEKQISPLTNDFYQIGTVANEKGYFKTYSFENLRVPSWSSSENEKVYIKTSTFSLPQKMAKRTGRLLPILNASCDISKEGININGFNFSYEWTPSNSAGTIDNSKLYMAFDNNYSTGTNSIGQNLYKESAPLNIIIKLNKPIIINRLSIAGRATVGENLEILSSQDGINYATLGSYSFTSKGTISFYERGYNNIDLFSSTHFSRESINFLKLSLATNNSISNDRGLVGLTEFAITDWLEEVE